MAPAYARGDGTHLNAAGSAAVAAAVPTSVIVQSVS
jgi:lysophospholipase L1-like esterase